MHSFSLFHYCFLLLLLLLLLKYYAYIFLFGSSQRFFFSSLFCITFTRLFVIFVAKCFFNHILCVLLFCSSDFLFCMKRTTKPSEKKASRNLISTVLWLIVCFCQSLAFFLSLSCGNSNLVEFCIQWNSHSVKYDKKRGRTFFFLHFDFRI